MAMPLRPLDEFDLVAGGERHDRLLPVGAPPLGTAHPLQLPFERGGPDGGYLDVEHGLDGHPDLDLVGVRPAPERDAVLLFLPAHALFRHEWRVAGEPEGTQRGDQRFRLSVGDVDRRDRRELAGRNLGRDRGAQRSAAHRARQVLVVAPGRRPKRLAATLPLDRPGRALPSPAGPLLLPRLPAAAGHLAPPLGVVRAGPTVGELSRHRLVEQWHADLDTEYVRFQLERAGLLALRVQHLYGRHRYFFSAIFCACCAFVAFTDFRSITRDPFAPGTAPRINTRFCSSITRTTERCSTVRRAPPMRPGIWWPGHTREGSDDAPIDPGAR